MLNIVRARETGEPGILMNGEPQIIFEARIGAIVNFPVLEDQGEGYVERKFEKYVRPPGVRVIACKDNKIYLQKEFRFEQENDVNGGWDWRLPGGKVVDSFQEYKQYLTQAISQEIVLGAGKKEFAQEAKLNADKITFFKKMICGTTVEWDLYYVVAEDISELSENVHSGEGEDIGDTQWYSFEEVLDMCKQGKISEGRSASALLQFISQR